MNTTHAHRSAVQRPTAADSPAWRRRTGRVALVALSTLLALMMLGASVPKLTGDPQMVVMFAEIGGGTPLRWCVGLAEAAGAVGLLVPSLRRPAALGLAALLAGASATNVVILHESPAIPIALGVTAGFVAWAQRRS